MDSVTDLHLPAFPDKTKAKRSQDGSEKVEEEVVKKEHGDEEGGVLLGY